MYDDPFRVPEPADAPAPAEGSTPSAEGVLSPAHERFKTCRWRAQPNGNEQTEHCTHRDVLPFAGREGFTPEAWCPECPHYKLRRTPRKRESY